jgi:dCMP deaminase
VTRPSWDDYFLDIARAVAVRADCTRRQVGAVIVDDQHRIISTGYNGAAAGHPGCASDRACPRGLVSYEEMPSYVDGNQDFSNCIAVHAEANALLYADGRHTRGATLYTTDKPCAGCERLIEGAGIIRVVYP